MISLIIVLLLFEHFSFSFINALIRSVSLADLVFTNTEDLLMSVDIQPSPADYGA